MCTLTVLKRSDGMSVFMNRDEHRSRTPELPPQMIDPEHGIFGPIDPAGGGTWIAHNRHGYWGCILNGYMEKTFNPPPLKLQSRGLILPHVLAQTDPMAAALALDTQQYQSFRLVMGSVDRVVLLVWDGQTLSQQPFHEEVADCAYFLTSSSWAQERVIAARCALFRAWIQGHATDLGRKIDLPSYHLSSQPSPEEAPLMTRSYARTKSITGLNITANGTDVTYKVIADEKPGIQSQQAVSIEL